VFPTDPARIESELTASVAILSLVTASVASSVVPISPGAIESAVTALVAIRAPVMASCSISAVPTAALAIDRLTMALSATVSSSTALRARFLVATALEARREADGLVSKYLTLFMVWFLSI